MMIGITGGAPGGPVALARSDGPSSLSSPAGSGGPLERPQGPYHLKMVAVSVRCVLCPGVRPMKYLG